jgi:hypothetical protein
VHKIFRTFLPFSTIVTRCKFGRKVLLVARIEKLRLCPNVVVFPQIAHFAIFEYPFKNKTNFFYMYKI